MIEGNKLFQIMLKPTPVKSKSHANWPHKTNFINFQPVGGAESKQKCNYSGPRALEIRVNGFWQIGLGLLSPKSLSPKP